jgi:hypothetical protein
MHLLIGCLLSAGTGACSSAPPPPPTEPAAPAPIVTPKAPPPPAPAPVPVASAEPPPATVASAEPEPAPVESPKPSRSPIDILTSPDTAFLIDYTGSAPIETARRNCAEKSGGEPEAQAKCLSDAREAFKADVIRFRKEGKDGSHWAWTVYKRAGNRLDEVTSGRVALTETSPSTVNLKIVTDKGMRAVLKNKREAVLTVPNDYSFELDDADWGTLKYEAKIGLVAN